MKKLFDIIVIIIANYKADYDFRIVNNNGNIENLLQIKHLLLISIMCIYHISVFVLNFYLNFYSIGYCFQLYK